MNETNPFDKGSNFLARIGSKSKETFAYPHSVYIFIVCVCVYIYIVKVKGKIEREGPLGSGADTWRNNEHNCWDEIGHVSLFSNSNFFLI